MADIPMNSIRFPGLPGDYKIPDPANLVPSGYTEGMYIISSTNTVSSILNEIWADMKTQSCRYVILNNSEGDTESPLHGGVWLAFIYKAAEQFGYVEVSKYPQYAGDTANVIKKCCYVFEGNWSSWKDCGSTSIDLLWRNPSWTSSFSEQTVNWNNNGKTYNAYLVSFMHSTSYGFEISVLVNSYGYYSSRVGSAHFPAGSIKEYTVDDTHRYFQIENNSCYFGKGYRNGSENQSGCIPISVYGIKW